MMYQEGGIYHHPQQQQHQQHQHQHQHQQQQQQQQHVPRYIRQSDYPFLSSRYSDNNQWTSISRTVEFLPAHTINSKWHNELNHQVEQEQPTSSSFHYPKDFYRNRILADANEEADDGAEQQSSSSSQKQTTPSYASVYQSQPFVDSTVEYDSYQQAWRLVGFMIDCDADSNNSYNNNNNNNQHHSGDNNARTGEGCQRYVIWAAYVDLDYEGGGIGEYQYWDRTNKAWDDTACQYVNKISNKNNNNNNNNNNKNNNKNNKQNYNELQNRCAKMDCHLPDTHWKLLGFYKHPSYDDWMGQLFKHEGMCIWTEDEYSFMKNARKAWPTGCTYTNTLTSDGKQIYYDLKPTKNGGITIGLYTDTKCIEEYRSSGWNDPITVENVVGNVLNNAGNGNSHDNKNNNKNNNQNQDDDDVPYDESLALWDDSFDAFKICQPCVAYDINNYGYSVDDDNYKGSAYGTYRYGYNDDYVWRYYGYYKYKSADFDCYDDAGYTNVNQCMKFMAKTTMYTATFRDLALANTQGTLVEYPLSGYRDGNIKYLSNSYHATRSVIQEYVVLLFSLAMLTYGIIKYNQLKKNKINSPTNLKARLV